MGYPLLQNTSVTVVLGPFVDDTDFKTPETALVINASDVRISKNGGSFAEATGSSTTHNENGYYLCTLAIANVDTLGSIDINVNVAGALSVYDSFTVESSDSYNAKYTTELQKVNVTQYIGTSITESSTGRMAGNISTFLDNGDTATAKTLDSIGDLNSTMANKTLIQEAMNELAVDTLTFEDFLNIGLSVFAGKFVANTTTGNTTFTRQDEITPTITINTTAAGATSTRSLTSYNPIP